MKLRCTFVIHQDGTVDLRWKNNDVISGPNFAVAADQIRAYVSASFAFAAEMGGMEQAHSVMRNCVLEVREQLAKLKAASPTSPETTGTTLPTDETPQPDHAEPHPTGLLHTAD